MHFPCLMGPFAWHGAPSATDVGTLLAVAAAVVLVGNLREQY